MCEVQAYVQLETHTNNCNIRHIHANTTIWIELSNANSWLYSARAKQHIEITCGKEATRKIEIKRTGQLILREKCKVVTPDVLIRANKLTITTYIQTHLPDYNLTKLLDRQTDETVERIRAIKLRKIIKNPTELMDLSERLNEISEDLDNNNYDTNKHIVYPIASSFTGIIVISVIIAILYVRKRHTAKKEKPLELNINPMCKPKAIQEHIYGIISNTHITQATETAPTTSRESENAMLY